VGFLLYGQTLWHAFLPFDDDLLITKNALLRDLGLTSIFGSFTRYDPELYIPLTFLSYQLDVLIGGLHPWVFHLGNLLLHICNALLVSLLGWTLIKKKFIAVAMGCIFLIHPLNVETVAWAAARKDLLSTFFFLASLIAFIHYKERGTLHQYRYSIELYLLALLSKVMAITLPAILLLKGLLDGNVRQKKTWTELIPFFFLTIIFFAVGLFGKKSALEASAAFEKILLAFKSSSFYILKLLWPTDLRVLYVQETPITIVTFILPIVCVALVLALALYVWKKKESRLAAFGIFFYFLTLAPTFLNTHKAGSIYFASDRYAYLPSVGLLLAVCIGLDALLHRTSAHKSLKGIAMGLGAAVACVLCVLTFMQIQTWQNGITLFSRALRYHPESALSYVNRGSAYEEMHQKENALKDYDRALQINPSLAPAWTNKANLLMNTRRNEEALYAYQMALKADVGYAPAHLGIGKLFHILGREKDARDAIQNAYKLDPNVLMNLKDGE
jgi:tetratricopeptide (TPR) repeat protein